jgi:hypothetical protein
MTKRGRDEIPSFVGMTKRDGNDEGEVLWDSCFCGNDKVDYRVRNGEVNGYGI